MPPIIRFFGRRLAQSVVIILGIVIVNFFVLNLAPGDMADVIAGAGGGGDADYTQRLRVEFGLDQPLFLQFWHYMTNLLQFDLGYSFTRNMPVSTLLMQRLPATLLLMISAIALSFLIGSLLGMIAGRNAGKPIDAVISFAALIGYAIPLFWLGLLLILLFTVHLGWFPSGGMKTIGLRGSLLTVVLDVTRHAVMPVLTLALFYIAVFTRLMRSSVIDVSHLDFVKTARAKGLSERKIYRRHILGNALLPVITMLSLQMGAMLGGSVVVETIFSWPGLGRLTFDAIFSRDINLLLGVMFLSSVCVVITNLLTDIAYTLIDPRIRLEA